MTHEGEKKLSLQTVSRLEEEAKDGRCYKNTQLQLHCSQTGYNMVYIATMIQLQCHAGIELLQYIM